MSKMSNFSIIAAIFLVLSTNAFAQGLHLLGNQASLVNQETDRTSAQNNSCLAQAERPTQNTVGAQNLSLIKVLEFLGGANPFNKGGAYCTRLTGTGIGWCSEAYHNLHPTAQAIIDAHEAIHGRQNPFVTTHAQREVEAWTDTLSRCVLWLAQNEYDAQGRLNTSKEWQDVNMLRIEADAWLPYFQSVVSGNPIPKPI